MGLKQSNHNSYLSMNRPTHYTPLEYYEILSNFHKRCPEGYELLRSAIDLCYCSDMSLREYWFKVFDDHFKSYNEHMDERAKQAYYNLYHEAKRKYLEQMVKEG